MSLKKNIENLKEIIEMTTIKTYGQSKDITILAASKYATNDDIINAYENGIKNFGESKVQDLRKKQSAINNNISWHLIGSLQTNKVKDIIDRVELIHSLDRLSLAKEIDRRAKIKNIIVPTLVQVNISKESTKSGIIEEKLIDFILEIEKYNNIQIKGLMTIGPYTDNDKYIRKCFKKMKYYYDFIDSKKLKFAKMEILSMGMSNDYKIAIEEGSNLIRVGSTIFNN